MEKQPLTYDFPGVKTPTLAFDGTGIISWGGGKSLILNELDQKPSDFTEDFTENLIENSGGIKGINAIKGIKGFSAAAFLFSRKLQSNNNKQSSTLLTTIQKMRKTTKLKAIALSMAMALGMLLPGTANAQNDDFFRTEDNFGGNRDFATTWAITNNGIGQSETPLGSGLLILTAVGAGYAVARRKSYKTQRTSKTHRSYNSGATLFLALALLIGMTNCRKNFDTINEVAQNGVHITLNVDGGEKVAVNPTGGGTYATVEWENGDILYVGNNGAYCGYLTYNSSTKQFSGTINPTSGNDGDYLHIYFMGNKGTTSEPTSVNITDQTSKYPVISYGRSTSLYQSGKTDYEATLYNKCAIAKFTITGVDTDKAITVTGMNNTVTVDFSKNGIGDVVNPYTYSKSGSGEIRLHAESNTERWAILLPQDEVTTATAYASGYTSTGAFTVPAVSANGYYDSGVAVAMASGSPVGAFTINSSNDKVFFAPGNLQYQASTSTWRFAENQWDYVGDATSGNVYVSEVKSNNASISSSYTGWIDLFGWGTSGIDGYTPIATCYQPYSTSTTNGQYNPYGSTSTNLYDGGDNAGKADWGYAASAANLGGYSTWRTLTKDEWVYVFNTRTVNGGTGSGKSYTLGQSVNGMLGVVLYPDDYTGSVYSGSDWSTFESAGCVFLPAAGYRDGTSVRDVGSYGHYWSSSCSNSNYAYYVAFDSGNVAPQYNSNRRYGFSVRLARVVE